MPYRSALLRQKCDLVDLPAANRMRNEEVNIGVSRRIIYACLEVPVRLEKLGVKFDLALDVYRAEQALQASQSRQ